MNNKIGGLDDETIWEVELCLWLARAWDGVGMNKGNEANQTEKDKRILPQIDRKEKIARLATEIAGLQRGRPMKDNDLSQGYSREYIIYMMCTQLKHLIDIQFKESFIEKPL